MLNLRTEFLEEAEKIRKENQSDKVKNSFDGSIVPDLCYFDKSQTSCSLDFISCSSAISPLLAQRESSI